jgi:hypothetical protein
MRTLLWISILAASGAVPGHAGPVRFLTRDLPAAIAGTPYQAAVETAVDGRCPYGGGAALFVAEGNLPRGLEIRGLAIAGTPRETGIFSFVLRGAVACGASTQPFTLLVTGKPILRVYPEELVFEARQGATPKPQKLFVSATWPNLPYEVRIVDGPWLWHEPAAGATPDQGAALSADPVAIRVVPGDLTPGVYHATVTVATWQGANAPEIPVTLRIVK